MPKKTEIVKGGRKGPRALAAKFEGQMELLGLPMNYVRSMILPESTDPVRVPDEVVATSAVFKAPLVIEDLPFTGSWDPLLAQTNVETSGETTVMAFPGTKGTLWHTASQPFPQTTNVYAQPTLWDGSSTLTVPGVGDGIFWMSHGLRVGDVGFLPRRTSNNGPMFQIQRNSLPGADLIVDVTSETRWSGVTQLRLLWRVGGVFAALNLPAVFAAGRTRVVFPDASLPPVMDAIGLGVHAAEGAPRDFRFSVTDEAAWISVQNNCTMYDIRHVSQLADMPLTSKERPTSLSLLTTFMGSSLLNGGNQAGARLPMAMNLMDAPLGDYYAYLASLPLYQADFPVRDGMYVWWCPDSEQEYFFFTYGEYACDDLRLRSSLVTTIRRDNPDQSMRARVDFHTETQTRSVLFNSLVSDYSATFPRALSIAKTLPAVTINDNHESLLTRAFNAAKNWVSKPSNWVGLLTKGIAML